MKLRILSILLLFFLVSACIDPGEPVLDESDPDTTESTSRDSNTTDDAASNETDPEDPTDPVDPTDPEEPTDHTDPTDPTDPEETCEPLQTCQADTCGMVDDGCGGTLDCGLCPCSDGVVQIPTCGTCDLGKTSCSGDTPSCELPPLEDITSTAGRCDAFLYVDTNAASGGDGTAAAPYSTYAAAAASVDANTFAIIVSAPAGKPLRESIDVQAGVHVIGGFSGTTYEPQSRAFVRPSLPSAGSQLYGLLAVNVDTPTSLVQLDIETPDDDPTSDRPNQAVIVNASSGISFVDVVARSGDAAAGTAGVDGRHGPDGRNGKNPVPSTRLSGQRNWVYNTPGAVGGAARNDCPNGDPTGAGGDGGDGGVRTYTSGNTASTGVRGGSASGFGSTILGGIGGRAGTDGGPEAGWDGNDAPDGDLAGSPITGGFASPLISAGGQLSDEYGTGLSGESGGNGAGGGGGGGSEGRRGDSTSSVVYEMGVGGASGGSGGCGGEGGTGGNPGHYSVGLTVYDSDVRLVDSTFVAGDGGEGGRGGDGGDSGKGGAGGNGIAISVNTAGNPVILPYFSGKGGDGGDGRPGAGGSGGAGGSSIGLFCEGGAVTVDDQNATTTFEHDQAGVGGPGGIYGDNGRGSPAGDDGEAADVAGPCAPSI